MTMRWLSCLGLAWRDLGQQCKPEQASLHLIYWYLCNLRWQPVHGEEVPVILPYEGAEGRGGFPHLISRYDPINTVVWSSSPPPSSPAPSTRAPRPPRTWCSPACLASWAPARWCLGQGATMSSLSSDLHTILQDNIGFFFGKLEKLMLLSPN